MSWGCRGGSVAKITCCPSWGFKFDAQYPCRGAHSGLHLHGLPPSGHLGHLHIHPPTHIHINKSINKSFQILVVCVYVCAWVYVCVLSVFMKEPAGIQDDGRCPGTGVQAYDTLWDIFRQILYTSSNCSQLLPSLQSCAGYFYEPSTRFSALVCSVVRVV